MEIISFGKANKIFKKVKELDEGVVGLEAETRFKSVDARLDWIEEQSTGLQAEVTAEVDLTRKMFEDTQYKDGAIQLKELSPGTYVGSGTWESDVVDLGEGWQETKKIEIIYGG